MEIVHGMRPEGKLILNGDEPLLCLMRGSDYKPIYVGIRSREADYRAMNIRYTSRGTTFDMIYHRRVATNVEIPILGEHHVYNALFAWAVGVEMGLSEDAIRRGLSKFHNTGLRQRIVEWEGVTILEDCYNASPESMEAALPVLYPLSKEKHGGRSVAVLGDMKELGTYAPRLPKRVGRFLGELGIDCLVTVGAEADDIAAGAVIGGMPEDHILQFTSAANDDIPAIADNLRSMLREGDTVLFKASRAMALERIVDALQSLPR
jgi:UDP-N-acetylmuramoyl-tripeptide--D-alanyl-D-alanine ligase